MWKCPKCGEEIEDQFNRCWRCAKSEPSPDDIESLESTQQGNEEKSKSDTYNYKGWLTSDRTYKRVLAIWGYVFLGYIFVIGIGAIIFIIKSFLIGIIKEIF